jgi:hypothetical protein
VGHNRPLPALAALLTFALWLTIGITISKSPTHQGIHDHFAGGTYVVRRVPVSEDTR